jgi:hypothetical protein
MGATGFARGAPLEAFLRYLREVIVIWNPKEYGLRDFDLHPFDYDPVEHGGSFCHPRRDLYRTERRA